MRRPAPPRAFTLIELLVVITIIVVLLALLTPALDTAIYQGELAVCGANLHGAAAGLVTYTVDHKRRYPYRKGVIDGGWQHAKLFDANRRDHQSIDPYFDINGVFNDPLSRAVDFENSQLNSHGYTPYALWYGWRFIGDKGMFKLGDRWTFSAKGRIAPQSHDLLMSDLDFVGDRSQVFGSHPDDEGVLLQEAYQDEKLDDELAFGPIEAGAINNFTTSRWRRSRMHERGRLDLNFAAENGSVERFAKVAWEEMIVGAESGRLRSVTWNVNDDWWPGLRVTVPLAR